MMSTRFSRITTSLQQHFAPQFIELVDESYKHQVPEGSESHFKLTLVSSHFNSLTRIERHRMVNTVLSPEMETGLHALSLALYTPEEWAKHPNTHSTPPCQHKQ